MNGVSVSLFTPGFWGIKNTCMSSEEFYWTLGLNSDCKQSLVPAWKKNLLQKQSQRSRHKHKTLAETMITYNHKKLSEMLFHILRFPVRRQTWIYTTSSQSWCPGSINVRVSGASLPPHTRFKYINDQQASVSWYFFLTFPKNTRRTANNNKKILLIQYTGV